MKRVDEILCQVHDTIGLQRFLPIVQDARQTSELFWPEPVGNYVVNSGVVRKHLDCCIDIVDPFFFYQLGVVVTTFPDSRSYLYNREKRILSEVLFAVSSVCCREQHQFFRSNLGGLFQED